MARLLVRSSSNRYTFSTGSLTDFPYTLVARIRQTSKGAVFHGIIGLFHAGPGETDKGMYIGYENRGGENAIQAVVSTGNNWVASSIGSVPAVGTWMNVAGVFSSTTSRQVWLNGSFGTAETSSRALAVTNLVVGAYQEASGGSYSDSLDGDIADAAILTVAATAAELDAFNAGFSPRAIWPANKIYDAYDFFGHITNEPGHFGHALTPNGTPAQSAHGGSYYYPHIQTWPLTTLEAPEPEPAASLTSTGLPVYASTLGGPHISSMPEMDIY